MGVLRDMHEGRRASQPSAINLSHPATHLSEICLANQGFSPYFDPVDLHRHAYRTVRGERGGKSGAIKHCRRWSKARRQGNVGGRAEMEKKCRGKSRDGEEM